MAAIIFTTYVIILNAALIGWVAVLHQTRRH